MNPSYSEVFLRSSIFVMASETGFKIKSLRHLLMNLYGCGSSSKYDEGLPAAFQLSSG